MCGIADSVDNGNNAQAVFRAASGAALAYGLGKLRAFLSGATAPRGAPGGGGSGSGGGGAGATGGGALVPRLPQDVNVNPVPPRPLPLTRPVGLSATQNARVQADIAAAQAAGARHIRVNQQQVNAAGQRVGTNRPDLQYTDASGRRVYVEYDTPSSPRGPIHQQRLLANDPTGQVILHKFRSRWRRMRLLFDGRLSPITSTVGFLEAPIAESVRAFADWERSVHEPLGTSVVQRPVTGGLEEVLLSLLPLTNIIPQRYLFVPTAGPWVAFFDNGHQGTDASSVISYLAQRLGCRGLSVTAVPDTIEGEFKGARGEYGALVLEVFGPDRTDFLNYVRSIALAHDGGRWVFLQSGTPFPFEDVSRYSARRVRARFTFELLERYLSELGLSPFVGEFYLPDAAGPAHLVEKRGAFPPGMKEYTLAEARTSPHG